MLDLSPERIADGLTNYVVLLFSLSVHESAHAWAAHKLGDDTAYSQGRVSLNPIVHMDPIGTVLFPLLQIFGGVMLLGWAKPTPYNPANFRRDVTMRKGHMLVAGAGPASNILLGVLFMAALVLLFRSGALETFHNPVAQIVLTGISINVVLAVFNLIPIPPLDGSKVASYGLPGNIGDRYDRVMEPYGFFILLVLLWTGATRLVLVPVMEVVYAVLTRLLR